MGSSFDVIGIMANTVDDVALILNEACKYDPKDSTSLNIKKKIDYSKFSDISKLKVGVLKFNDDGVEKDVMTAFSNSIEDIKKLGCSVKEVVIDHLKYVIAAYYILVPSEISANMARFDGIRFGYHPKGVKDLEEFYIEARSKFEDEVKRRILIGTYTLSSGYYDAYYSKADAVRRLIKQEFDEAFRDVDVIVSPTSPTVAYRKDKVFDNPLELYLSDIFTIPANLIGAPAISIPNGLSCDNLPTGLQIMGPQLSELNILSLANKLYKKYG
jgi:aspartyl-tRNA(Asn)/glutamyl-tRNA(Gln) amidotransferase subunit A